MEHPLFIYILTLVFAVLFLVIAWKIFYSSEDRSRDTIKRYPHASSTPPGPSDLFPSPSEKRAFPRVVLENTVVNVTDGCIFCTAVLHDISRSGVRISGLPDDMYKNSDLLTLFTPDSSDIPVLKIKPRWENRAPAGKSIGGIVTNPSRAWSAFVRLAGTFAAGSTAKNC